MNRIMTVNLHGTALYGSKLGDIVYVALKPMVEAMGLAWQSQLQRVKRDPILREGVTVMVIPTPRGPQNSVGLRLDLVSGWLFTISSMRIKSGEIRERIQLFQRECYDVLSQHFLGRHIQPKQQSNSYERSSVRMVNEARLI